MILTASSSVSSVTHFTLYLDGGFFVVPLFKIIFIGVTLVNVIISVSGMDFCVTISV